MRTLAAAATTEKDRSRGAEPITVIGIDWGRAGAPIFYADKDLDEAKGKILDFGAVDDALTLSSSTSSSVSFKLEDSDGTILNMLNTKDTQNTPCTIYHYFGDLDFDDKFIIFKGVLETPITWSRGDRSIDFTVVTEIEGNEIGFSPEEGQFDFVSPELNGKPWPLAFGKVLHVPATKVREITSGELAEVMSIEDPTLQTKIDALHRDWNDWGIVAGYFAAVAAGADALARPVQDILDDYAEIVRQYRIEYTNIALDQLDIEEVQRKRDREADEVKRDALEFDLTVHEISIDKATATLNNLQSAKIAIEGSPDTVGEYQWAIFEQDVKRDAFKQQLEAVNKMTAIYQDYIELEQTQCDQRNFVKSSITVKGGNKFEQGVSTDVSINNVVFRGKFSGNKFTEIYGPIATYKDVEVDTWSPVDDECGRPDEASGIEVFYIVDGTVNMKGRYALVTDHRGDKHLIKVKEQEGTKCTFELVKKATSDSGSGLQDSSITGLIELPDWEGESENIFSQVFGMSLDAFGFGEGQIDPNQYNTGERTLSNDLASALGGVPISNEEFEILWDLQRMVPFDEASDGLLISVPSVSSLYLLLGKEIREINAVAGVPLASWMSQIDAREIPDSVDWWANPGDKVLDIDNSCEIYVANILPSTVESVMAYVEGADNKRVLMTIPDTYYEKNEAEDLGPITAVTLKFKVPLSTIEGENWDDQVYVSMTEYAASFSNVVIVLMNLIGTYTNKTFDIVSFNAVSAQLSANYPANFALLERRNINEVMSEMAWQARLSLTLRNDVYYLHNLADEPTSVGDITKADIELASMQVTQTSTDAIITRLTANWRPDYLPGSEKKFVLRHNVNRYGIKDGDFNFYIFNDQDIVEKMATYWLIRYANIWKQLTFNTFYNNIEFETNDALTLTEEYSHFADAEVIGLLESVSLDTNNYSIHWTMWLPVRAGEMTAYDEIYHASLNVDVEFPSEEDIANGYAGGSGIGKSITGPVAGC